MADFTGLIAPDIKPELVRRVLDDEFVRGNVELALHCDDGQKAEQTVVVPVFNQQGFIRRCLKSIANNISASSDLVVILDCCTDQSETAVLSFVREASERFRRVIILRTTYPLFETRCDNLGFLLSRGNYVIEIQSDIEVLSERFDALLAAPMVAERRIFSTSGRGGCWFGLLLPKQERKRRFPVRSRLWVLRGFDRVGYTGAAVALSNAHTERAGYAHAETVMRGPWCLRRRDLLNLKLLDEQNFFLGYDDHDLHARGYDKGLRCAYVPMRFNAPLELGPTRRERTGINLEAFVRLKQRPCEGYLPRFLETYRPVIPCRYVR